MLVATVVICGTASADLADISNYLEYSETFSSSGQPNRDQLQDAWVDGFERVIYLAFSDHETSLENEDRIAKELGMEYVNIPVNWGSPTVSDFNIFASVMKSNPQQKTLVHCQVNYRASSFSFLYRVIYEDIPVAVAKRDMNLVWTPNSVWTTLILEVLAQHDISSECEDCDWTPQQH
jgi:protein tyrosine phosphatase (PTP) superfamily phosphohydrolase (DUF442 family)